MDDQKIQELQNRGKEIYDGIMIPPELDEIVKKTIGSRDKESIDKQYKETRSPISEIMKYIGAAAAAITVSIIIGLNSSESFAKEMGEVPVLGAVAKVFTVRQYTIKKENLTIDTSVPNVEIDAEEQTPEEKHLLFQNLIMKILKKAEKQTRETQIIRYPVISYRMIRYREMKWKTIRI